MSEFDDVMTTAALLAALLIIVAYFAGSTSVLNSLFSGFNTLWLTATGRNSSGQFGSYPGNAPSGS